MNVNGDALNTTSEIIGTPRVGLAETKDGVAFIVEGLGPFLLPVEDWQALWKAIGYRLRKRHAVQE